jgi:hypothetical protein
MSSTDHLPLHVIPDASTTLRTDASTDKRLPCDGQEPTLSCKSRKERSSSLRKSNSRHNRSVAFSHLEISQNQHISVDSDATTFMNEPLCAPPVTGHHVYKEYSKNIAKKLKRFSKQFHSAKSTGHELAILAIM